MKQLSSRTMSISHSDFFRLLPRALESYQYNVNPPHVTVHISKGELAISLDEESVHKIASLTLPSTKVHFEFKDVDDADMEIFFEKFEMSFRRGGG